MNNYIGSCSDDSIGIGTILFGSEYRRTDEGFELLTQDGWITCYDVVCMNVKHVDI